MLGRLFKLMKYEFKCTFRSFGLIYLVILAASLFLTPENSENTFVIILTFIYGISIGTLLVVNFVTIVRNFYVSMFQKTSYLTQTLPVKSGELVASKLIISYFWIAVSIFVILLSTFIIAFRAQNASFNEVLEALSQMIRGMFDSDFWYVVLYMIIVPMQSILLFYMVMTAVHTRYFRKYRLLSGIILYFIINYLVSRIATGFVGLGSAGGMINASYMMSFYNYTETQAWVTLGYWAILSIVFFFATCYILDHKLEIE